MRAMLIALPFLALFYNRDSLWLTYSGMIPGAVAIRAFGRVVLILLVPAALGLACSGGVPGPEAIDHRELDRRPGMPCRARDDDRDASTRRRTGRRSRASRAGSTAARSRSIIIRSTDPTFRCHHLDAMWASLSDRSADR